MNNGREIWLAMLPASQLRVQDHGPEIAAIDSLLTARVTEIMANGLKRCVYIYIISYMHVHLYGELTCRALTEAGAQAPGGIFNDPILGAQPSGETTLFEASSKQSMTSTTASCGSLYI